jgi:hypothetical protein
MVWHYLSVKKRGKQEKNINTQKFDDRAAIHGREFCVTNYWTEVHKIVSKSSKQKDKEKGWKKKKRKEKRKKKQIHF